MDTLTLENALALVRSAGFRVSKPKLRKFKADRVGPTFVCELDTGAITRLSCHCPDEKLDYARGLRTVEFVVAHSPRLSAVGGRPVRYWFERDGERLGEVMQ